jgi:hypothetical protein
MITLDALGKNGHSILHDLQGASPTGGPMASEWRDSHEVNTGDLVRSMGGWCVVAGIRRDGMTGITVAALVDHGGLASRLLLTDGGVAEVRSDTRIDPSTLWKLAPGMACAPDDLKD